MYHKSCDTVKSVCKVTQLEPKVERTLVSTQGVFHIYDFKICTPLLLASEEDLLKIRVKLYYFTVPLYLLNGHSLYLLNGYYLVPAYEIVGTFPKWNEKESKFEHFHLNFYKKLDFSTKRAKVLLLGVKPSFWCQRSMCLIGLFLAQGSILEFKEIRKNP